MRQKTNQESYRPQYVNLERGNCCINPPLAHHVTLIYIEFIVSRRHSLYISVKGLNFSYLLYKVF